MNEKYMEMTFSLKAENAEAGTEQFTCFAWRHIMEKTGAGYVLGAGFYGDDDPGRYVYEARYGCSPLANDGFRVTGAEATAMAMCCRGYVDVKRYIDGDGTVLRAIERFAKFAEQSGGFSID
jgi:hypothetical protein